MQTARVFSSLLYQTVMVLVIQKKPLQEPLQKTLAHKAVSAILRNSQGEKFEFAPLLADT